MNNWKRKALAITAIALLSTPSALGVYSWLAPLRGFIAAGMAAAGFELAYLSLSLLLLSGELRDYAQRTAYTAVSVAVLLNVCVDYAAKTNGLGSTHTFIATFDILSLVLAVVESLPAVLAFNIASLMHRLNEQEQEKNATIASVHATSRSIEEMQETIQSLHTDMEEMATKIVAMQNSTASSFEAINSTSHQCESCGQVLSKGTYGASKRYSKEMGLQGVFCTDCRGVLKNGNGNGHSYESVEGMEVICSTTEGGYNG